ncbi:MAG: TerC family protein [Candidatus Nanopelagicales bacterium]|jgi:tellurite resistance protein TerC
MVVELWVWIALLAIVLVMLAVDLFMHRDAHVISVKEAAIWSLVWVGVATIVGALVWWYFGSEFGMQYFAGYLIEKSLAVDNVFVWALIFSYFAVPREHQHRVLFYGVIGALVFRAIFIAAGSALIASAAWVLYIFGAFLIFTGIKMMVQRNEHFDVSQSRTLKLFRRLVRTSDEYEGSKFLTRKNGILFATPLLAVLVVVEFTDIIFAVDSIPAIFAVTQEPFIVFASNALAILGLRAMYFLLADLMHRFIYLKIGLSLVLVWVGIKMILGHAFFDIPTAISLGVVVLLIATSVIASLIATKEKSDA